MKLDYLASLKRRIHSTELTLKRLRELPSALNLEWKTGMVSYYERVLTSLLENLKEYEANTKRTLTASTTKESKSHGTERDRKAAGDHKGDAAQSSHKATRSQGRRRSA